MSEEPMTPPPEETPSPEKKETGKFHPEQIGPYATKEKLDAQINAELKSLFESMEAQGIASERAELIKTIKDEVFTGFDEGFQLGEKSEPPLSEEKKRVVTLEPCDAPAHDKTHSQKVLLGTIAVCKQLVNEYGGIMKAADDEERAALVQRLANKLNMDPEYLKEVTAEEIRSLVDNMLAAAKLHDIGYFKREGENVPNGACFALVHEERSMEFAKIYLQQKGWGDEKEIETVLALIGGTIMDTDYQTVYKGSPLLGQAAKLLHLADMASYFCSHDREIEGIEEIPFLLWQLYREFTYPQAQKTDRFRRNFITLNGDPETDEVFYWTESKATAYFGPDLLFFLTSGYIESQLAEMEEFYRFLDQEGTTNLFRQGHEITIRRQKALATLLKFPEITQREKPQPTLSDIAYFEGLVDEHVWIASLQECGLLESADQDERLRIRMKSTGVEASTKEPSLQNLIERLPTALIKEKLVEIGQNASSKANAHSKQGLFLAALFRNAAFSSFREGISHLEVRFAIHAYSSDLREELGERALSWTQAASAACAALHKATSEMKEKGTSVPGGKREIPPNSEAEVLLIPLLRQEKDPLGDQSFFEEITNLAQANIIAGLTIGGLEKALIDPERKNLPQKILACLEMAREYGLKKIEFHIGQEAIPPEEIDNYRQAVEKIIPETDRIVTGVAAEEFDFKKRDGKLIPLAFSPFTLHQMGIPLSEIYGVIKDFYIPGERNLVISTGNSRIEAPICNWAQLIMAFEDFTERRLEEVFVSDEPDRQDESVGEIIKFLRSMTPNIGGDPKRIPVMSALFNGH